MYLKSACKQLCFPPRKKYKQKKRMYFYDFFKFVDFRYGTEFDIINCLHLLKTFSLIIEEIVILLKNEKIQFSLHELTECFPQHHGNFGE